MVRQWGPFDTDISVYYLSANRNKKGIGIDFRNPDGLALIKKMALKSDVVVENFKVGTMESMGLGYEELAREKPDHIMARSEERRVGKVWFSTGRARWRL